MPKMHCLSDELSAFTLYEIEQLRRLKTVAAKELKDSPTRYLKYLEQTCNLLGHKIKKDYQIIIKFAGKIDRGILTAILAKHYGGLSLRTMCRILYEVGLTDSDRYEDYIKIASPRKIFAIAKEKRIEIEYGPKGQGVKILTLMRK